MNINNKLARNLREVFPNECKKLEKGKVMTIAETNALHYFVVGFYSGLVATGNESPYIQLNLVCGRIDRLIEVKPELEESTKEEN